MSQDRIRPLVKILILAAALSGCQDGGATKITALKDYQPSLLQEEDFHAAAQVVPPAAPQEITTVLSPDRPPRLISLAECIALALENGRTGDYLDRNGTGSAIASTAGQGAPLGVNDSIRVFAYDPAITATNIDQSLSKFDAIFRTGFLFDRYDEPPGVDLLGLQGLGSGEEFTTIATGAVTNGVLGLFDNLATFDTAQFRSEILKPLPTGGVAGITFRTDYVSTDLPINVPFVGTNAVYRPAVDLTFEQPLLKGASVLINQLNDSLPEPLRNPVPTGGKVPGILLTRIAHNEAKLEFERRVHQLLFAVEAAYWDLYSAYYDLYSRGEAMKEAMAAWQIAKKRYDLGTLDVEDLAQIEGQYQAFRAQRLEALGDGATRTGVLEAERRLRYVLGMPPEDGSRLVPMDAPTDAPVEPCWQAAVVDATTHRPELLQIEQEVHAAELRVTRAKNLLLPDLRFLAKYNVNGAGDTLGAGLNSLADDRYHDWELGLVLQVPIGNREAHAEVRRAKLQLEQRLVYLNDQQAKVITALQRSVRNVVQLREEIRIRRSRREAAAIQLKRRTEKFQAGRETIDFLLQAQRDWADAIRDEYTAVSRYNVALADYRRQMGTIMVYDNVTLAEGPLPAGVKPRASECIRSSVSASGDGHADATPSGPPAHSPAADATPSGPPARPPAMKTADASTSLASWPEPAPISQLLKSQDSLPEQLGAPPQQDASVSREESDAPVHFNSAGRTH